MKKIITVQIGSKVLEVEAQDTDVMKEAQTSKDLQQAKSRFADWFDKRRKQQAIAPKKQPMRKTPHG